MVNTNNKCWNWWELCTLSSSQKQVYLRLREKVKKRDLGKATLETKFVQLDNDFQISLFAHFVF